jgi:phthiocerol/phenolphthiocerol synthesis type-I polyketide synthase B
MAPNPAAQMAVLRSAYTNAGVPAHEVDYVEAHGTGTFLGDPIEARALGSVLGRGRSEKSPLLVGALKSNIGHLEAAAGIAGFIKAVMAVDRGEIPANLNFKSPNPYIPFDQLRLKVVAEHQDWPSVTRARRAGVSSFGFGGTNAHVVIEQGPDSVITEQQPDSVVSTLIVSGSTSDRIASTAEALAEWMAGAGADVGLEDVAHTLNHHRSRHGKFATVCARDRAHAIAGLRALADGRPADGVAPAHEEDCGSGTVFVYSGQGAHWAGMGKQLLEDEPAFAAAIDELEPVFNEQVGFSLKQVIAEGEEITGDARVQPVIMGLQLALTELWRSYEVFPDAVIGHSMGEVTAAVVAGALSVEDGLRVIAIRSTLMSRLAGQGAVALVKLTAEATESLIGDYPGLSPAGYVSPSQTVVAGPPDQVDALIAELTSRNVFARRVNMEVASHTELMDPILEELHAELADLVPQQPTIPLISTVQDTSAPLLDANYWVSNLRQPVRMQQAIITAAAVHTTFVEISAHPMLTNAVSDTLGDTHHHTVGTLWRDGDDTVSFHANLNATHTSQPPDLPHPPEPHAVLPTTPWHHARHWMDLIPPVRSAGSVGRGGVSPVGLGSVIPAEWNCELMWPSRPLTDEADLASGSWLVIGDGPIGSQIDRLLGKDSAVTVLAEDVDQAALGDALRTAAHVLYAPAVSRSLDVDSAYRLFNTGRRLAMALAAAHAPPKLVVLTRNAQPVFEGDRANPAHATLWGLGRTLALEHPEVWGGIVDIDESVPPVVAARYVLAEAGNPDGEDQIVYRAGMRRAPRLQRRTQATTSSAVLAKECSYLVVGATGNIGPHLIQQLADMGAGTVVAVSRNPGSRLQQLTETLSERGVTLVTVAVDASDKTSMSALFERFGADLPPLGGVYLAAFGGGPITLSDMTEAHVKAMFAPKLDAAAVLHELSLDLSLQQFVLFTSISGITGSRWLAHYTATTTFLDALVFARRAAGLPATAINWGLWKSLADGQSEEDRHVTLGSGLEPLPDEVAIQALPLVTGPGAPVRSTIVAADWPQLAAVYRTRAALRVVDDLLPNADGDDGDTASTRKTQFRTSLENCEPDGRHGLLAHHVSELVASVMGLESVQLLDPLAGFFQFGMDSLMSVTLQRALTESLGEVMPSSVIFDYPTVDALTGYLATILPELIEAADQEAGDEYDEFSEAELLQQLSERLSSGG